MNDDIALLGFGGTARPMQSLNLAGSDGFLSPQAIAEPRGNEPFKTPDYVLPDMSTPALQPGDLATCGVDYVPERTAITSDPSLPPGVALPDAVHVVTDASGLLSEPGIAKDVPSTTDIAASLYPGLGFPGLSVNHDPTGQDSGIPDFQNPATMPDHYMSGRPGDLDANALTALHSSPQYEMVQGKAYPDVYMDAHKNNSRRSREFTLLMGGLDAQGRRKLGGY